MEDILTSTGAIDAMAEEMINPTRQYDIANSPSSPTTTITTMNGGSKVAGEEGSDGTRETSRLGYPSVHVTGAQSRTDSVGCGVGGSEMVNSSSGRVVSKKLDGNDAGRLKGHDRPAKCGTGAVADPSARIRPGPPPKLPPKPPGLLDKVKEAGGGTKPKPLSQQEGKAQTNQAQPKPAPSLGHQNVLRSPMNRRRGASKESVESSEDAMESAHSRNMGSESRTVVTRVKPKVEMKPPVPSVRNPVVATRSAQPAAVASRPLIKDLQRSSSSPPSEAALHTKTATSPPQVSPSSSTYTVEKEPNVMSRVHNIQVHHRPGPGEIAPKPKKLSITDHHIKVRERAAVFESIVKGISEEKSVVSLDIDAAGARKRSARKPEFTPPPVPTTGQVAPVEVGVGGEMGVVAEEESDYSTLSSEVAHPPPPHPAQPVRTPVPRPRSCLPDVKDTVIPPPPTPQPRTTSRAAPVTRLPNAGHDFSPSGLSPPRTESAAYDEVLEFAASDDVTATLTAHEAEEQNMATAEMNLNAENIYEDTLFFPSEVTAVSAPPPLGSLPPCPVEGGGEVIPATGGGDTCRDPSDLNSAAAAPKREGPLSDSSATTEEMLIVTGVEPETPSERGSIYEVCFSEDRVTDQIPADDSDTLDTSPTTTTELLPADSTDPYQEMPTQRTPDDLITPCEDESEESPNVGMHKLSRQRRQRHFAVKMRSAEGSGLGPRRGGELKRHGRSLPDIQRPRVREDEEEEEEEREGMIKPEDREEEETTGVYHVTQSEPSDDLYTSLYNEQGSDGNEDVYEEVPSLSSSDSEEEKDTEELTTAQGKDRGVSMRMEDGVDEERNPKDEREDSFDEPTYKVNIRDRAKTSPESVRATARQGSKKKRHSEGAFEDFVPLFFKKKDADGPAVKEEEEKDNEGRSDLVRRGSKGSAKGSLRPKSAGSALMEDIMLIRAEIERRKERRRNEELAQEKSTTETQDNPDDGPGCYTYVTEVDLDNGISSSENSDYEEVCEADGTSTHQPAKGKHSNASSGVYDLEEHRRTLSREGSQASGGSADYLVLYDDWKAVEENGLIARRNKGSNEKKERRRVFPMDSSSGSDANMTHSTTQGSVDLRDLSDTQMSDEAGVYGSCDRPSSPETKKRGLLLPGVEVTPPAKPVDDETPPPLPDRKISAGNLQLGSPKGFMRKPSRFVGKEPLFQIYQADVRQRDSKEVLKPRTARRSKKPPLPARTFLLQNKNLPRPPVPRNHPLANRPSPPSQPPPPLPARTISNLSKSSNSSNMTNMSLHSSNASPNSTRNILSTEIRVSLQKELFSKLNSSSDSTHNDNFSLLPPPPPLSINNNIRSGDSHKIMDSSRTCSGNSVMATGAKNENEMDMSSGNEEGSSSMYSCEDDMVEGEMERNRTHGSSMETRSSQQSTEGAIEEDPTYQSGLGMEDPIYQSGMDDPIYQSGMDDPIYQSGMDDPVYSQRPDGEYSEEDSYDVFDDFDDDDDDYYKPPPRDGPVREGSVGFRSYWCELPEVLSSGLLENLKPEEKKLQEALFEIITSEASYLRSLNLVVHHFAEAPTLLPPLGVLKRPEHHSLFSNIKAVRDISERLLLELEQHQQDSMLLSDVCRILHTHLRDLRFEQGFVTYCANNQYQVRTLYKFKNDAVVMNAIRELESSPECCSLDLLSFLMLPFQRITRLPLLLEAVISRAPEGSDMMKHAVDAFTEVRKMAEKCNDEAKRMEMIEEVTILARMLDFKQGIKKMDISQSSTIVKRGTLDTIVSQANILGGKKKPIAKHIHCIVFTDKVLLAKEKTKGEQKRYDVLDWCPRNLLQVQPIDQPSMNPKLGDGVPPDCHCVFTLNMLQNNQKKTAEFVLNAKSLSERQRWMDALCPPSQTEDGETIYESWDCPQVVCTANYDAADRDELSLEVSDRVDVYKKVEGWYEGQLVGRRDRGWFPATCVQEVMNDHVRARILKNRHKILSMCEEQIRLALGMPKAK